MNTDNFQTVLYLLLITGDQDDEDIHRGYNN